MIMVSNVSGNPSHLSNIVIMSYLRARGKGRKQAWQGDGSETQKVVSSVSAMCLRRVWGVGCKLRSKKLERRVGKIQRSTFQWTFGSVGRSNAVSDKISG